MQPNQLNNIRPLLRAKPILRSIPLPTQPEVLRKILDEYHQPSLDLRQVAKWVSSDVSLSGAVLQIVNAPLFGLDRTITSIPQAIRLLGPRRLLLLIRAVSLHNGFGGGPDCDLFWKSANEIARLSLLLADRLQLSEKDELYTVSLVHDCGLLLMMQHFPDYKKRLIDVEYKPGDLVTDWEDAHYGLNHADLSFLISVSWFLPPVLCHAIAFHHQPFSETHYGRRRVEVASILLAALKTVRHIYAHYQETLVTPLSNGFQHMMRGTQEDHEWARDSAAILKYLGVSELDFLNLRDDLIDALENNASAEG